MRSGIGVGKDGDEEVGVGMELRRKKGGGKP